MHQFSAAMHMEFIDPSKIVISLPHEDWWKLGCSLERQYRGILVFDGRGHEPREFKYNGITFKAA